MNIITETLYKDAIKKWGKSSQVTMCIEECAELIKQLAKFGRFKNGSTVDKVLDEMVDVEIMIGQLKVIFDYFDYLNSDSGYSMFALIKEKKLLKLEKLLNGI